MWFGHGVASKRPTVPNYISYAWHLALHVYFFYIARCNNTSVIAQQHCGLIAITDCIRLYTFNHNTFRLGQWCSGARFSDIRSYKLITQEYLWRCTLWRRTLITGFAAGSHRRRWRHNQQKQKRWSHADLGSLSWPFSCLAETANLHRHQHRHRLIYGYSQRSHLHPDTTCDAAVLL